MPRKQNPPVHNPTPVELQILLCLGENPLHGYGIKQEIEQRTDGDMRVGPGTLYEAIQRLEATGCIQEAPTPPGEHAGRRRKRFYDLTSEGRQAMVRELSRLERIVQFARDRKLLTDTQ